MQDTASESKSTKRKIIRSIWFWIPIGLVIIATLIFILFPVGIDYGIEHYLENKGADEVTLERVSFNPFTRRLTLNGMHIKIGSQTTLKIPAATFIIDWSAFIHKRFVLESFNISDTELVVKELSDGRWQIGGINLPDQKETSEPSSWNFGLQQVTVKNSAIKFISSQLSTDLKIEQAKISKLSSWLPERKAQLEFEGQLNEAKLELQMVISPFGNDVTAAGRVKLKDLSLAPFAPLLQPHLKSLEGRLDADLNIETRQMSDTGFSYLQKGRLNLNQVRTRIEDTDFANKNLAWDGTVRIDIPKAEKTLKIAANGRLNGSQFAMASQNKNPQIQQEHVIWEGKVSFEQTPGAANLNADSVLTLQNTMVNAPDVKLTEEKLNWKGTVQLSFVEKAGEQRILANGNLASGLSTISLMQENLNLTNNGLDWQGKFDYAQEKASTNINTDGQMRIASFKMESPQVNLAEEELTWKGLFQFYATAEAEGQKVIADGALNGSQLLVHLLNRKLKFKHKGLSWRGRLDSAGANDLNSLKAEADVILSEVEILNAEKDQPLLNSKRVDLQSIKIDGLNKINVSGIEINGLAVLSEPQAAQSATSDRSVLSMQALKFEDARLSQQKDLAIDTISLQEVKAFVRRNPQGKWAIADKWGTIRSDIFVTDQARRSASNIDAQKKSEEFGFRIGKIEITGGSKLQFQDESVSPTFSINLSLLEARLVDLDSRQPEKPATLKLLLSDKEDARLSLDGTVQPFAGKLSLDWVGKIESLELPPLSPYVIQKTGYRFISGEMEADIPIKINQNQLEGKIDLILYKPKVERTKVEKPPEEKQGKIRLNMSLDSALKLMRDKQNNVKINIPISGDISDPQFSVADAVNKVLAKTLQTSALSYLKYMLGPYGIGISVAEFAYKRASKIRLNPILFEPGSTELDEPAIDYLKRVSAIMEEHPATRLDICGVATESDRAAQKELSASTTADDILLELAKSRTERIKEQLVKLHGIATKRLITCEPKIDKSAGAKPRVNLEI